MTFQGFQINAPDAELVESIERLGYIPVSWHSAIKNRIDKMKGDLYVKAAAMFQRFTLDPIGNITISPQTYQQNRAYSSDNLTP